MNPPNNNSDARSRAASAVGTVGADPVDGVDPFGVDPIGADPIVTDAVGADPVAADGIGEHPAGDCTISLVRLDRLRNLLPGNDSLLDELIDLFVSDLPKRLNAIAEAVERADGKTLALQAHALRGSAANFGASRLDHLCGRVEEIGVNGTLAEAFAMLHQLGAESERVRAALLALKSEPRAMPADAWSTARR
jgi:HPt (histidine-containing phosphotransfer) domain-containing protein